MKSITDKIVVKEITDEEDIEIFKHRRYKGTLKLSREVANPTDKGIGLDPEAAEFNIRRGINAQLYGEIIEELRELLPYIMVEVKDTHVIHRYDKIIRKLIEI